MSRWNTNTLTVFALIVLAISILTGIPKKEIKWSEAPSSCMVWDINSEPGPGKTQSVLVLKTEAYS